MEEAMTPSLTAVGYRDRKRYAWLFSVLVPMTSAFGSLVFLVNGRTWAMWAPVIFFYGIGPLIDWMLGEDLDNPPEEAVPALEADPYYRYLTYAIVPMLWAAFTFSAWFFAKHGLPAHAIVALIINTGSIGGFCINVGHELGHKRSALERWLARIILAPTCYGNFYIEHNRGHHRDVATPEDPASARMGESIYRFALREMPGAFRRAWQLEADRLTRVGKSAWSLSNEIVPPMLLTAVYWAVLTLWLGWHVLPFLLLSAFWANYQLTSANYVEHYGLLRRKMAGGQYEICRPHHSWNSNHMFSNLALFHLQRHSDHHAHPSRRYQALRHFEDLPQLPNGYFGMFLLAYVPLLWFRVMDKRLLNAVGRDASLINFAPAKRSHLLRKYRLQPAP